MNKFNSVMILSVLVNVTLSTLNATPTGAYAEDMSVREVEALLQERVQGLTQSQIHGLTRHLLVLCRQYNFPVSSVLSVIATESSFKVDAVSPVGAIGLMQLMPVTAKYIAKKANVRSYHGPEDLYDPKTNVSIGVAYLSLLRDRFVQSHRYLAAYNMGPAKFNRVMKKGRGKPQSVAKYVMNVHNGVYKIRHHAQSLIIASVGR